MNQKLLIDFLNSPEGLELGKKMGNAFSESLKVFIETLSKELTETEKAKIESLLKMVFYDEIEEFRTSSNQLVKELIDRLPNESVKK